MVAQAFNPSRKVSVCLSQPGLHSQPTTQEEPASKTITHTHTRARTHPIFKLQQGTHTCNSSSWEPEEGGSWVEGQL